MVVTVPSEGPMTNQVPFGQLSEWVVVVVVVAVVVVVVACVCLVGGVLCGSGSSSDDEVEDESEEESDESSGVDLSGGRSPSGSSRARVLGSGLWGPEEVPGCRGVLSDTSIGGGSSTCICVAVLSSAAVGMAPRSTYLDPDKLLWLRRLASCRMSYVRVSNEVAIRRCSGAALIRVPAWLSQATMGAPLWPFSTAITLAGPLYP